MSDVLTRVTKLLKLAKNAGTEAEAATAAARAAALMAEHEISEAAVRLAETNDPATARAAEPIIRHDAQPERNRRGKAIAWHAALASGITDKLGCRYYYAAGTKAIIFFGRQSTVQAAAYMLQYLIRQVDQVCQAHCDAGVATYRDVEDPDDSAAMMTVVVRVPPSRTYRNAFRIGCAHRVAARLREQAPRVMDAPTGDASATETPPPSAGVLMVLKRDREEVNAAYENIFKGGKSRSVAFSGPRDGSGYQAGRAAGDRVSLGGNARGGLAAGRGVLP